MVGPAGLAPDFSGLSLDQAREVCPLLQADAQLPWPWWTRETESKADLVARLDAAVDVHSHSAVDLLIITHGGPMNAATKTWLERAGEAPPQWLDCWNTQVNRFHRDASGNWHCDALADTAHLSGPEQHSCNELDYNAMRTLREMALQG